MSLDDEFKEEIVHGTFWQVEVPNEGMAYFPQEDYTMSELMALFEVDTVNEATGYFVELMEEDTGELSWHGPFDNEDDLEDHLVDLMGNPTPFV